MSIPTVSEKELNAVYIKKTQAQSQLDALNKKHDADMQKNLSDLSVTKDKVIADQEQQKQIAADALYSVQQAIQQFPLPGTIEFSKDRSIEGFTALGKAPSVKEIVEGAAKLRRYINDYKNNVTDDINKLKAEHDELVKQNGILAAQTEAAKQEVATIAQQGADIQAKYIADNTVAHSKLDDANNAVINKEKQRIVAEKQRADEAAARERLKRQLMLWCGIAAALCVVGVIYSPVGKQGLVIMAATFGGAAAAIPFIEPWMVFAGLAVVAAVVMGHILYSHGLADKTNKNLVSAIQDSKETPNATVDTLLANIKDWNTVYTKDKAGNVITKTDTAVESYIQQLLMDAGRLPTSSKVALPATVVATPSSGSVA